MYFFYWFGDLFGLAMIIALVYLLFSHHRLKKRVASLEGTQRDMPADPQPIATQQAPAPMQAAEAPPVAAPAPTADADADDIAAAPVAPPPPEPVTQDLPPRAFVFNPDQLTRFVDWAKENWFLLVAALSLAMAGVYLVQYGIEQGLLTPQMRVLSALAFGAILIGAGEWIRRRMGDEEGHTAFLPSTLAGAGVVAIFTGIFAARQLYGLIGSGMAFTGLGLTGLMALVLGWFYGPFLIAIGLVGGAAAPFLVGDSGRNPHGLYYYFALIAVIGLSVDTIKRIAWISVLGLALAFVAAFVLFDAKDGALHYLAFAVITLAATATIPVRSLMPSHGGAMMLETLRFKGRVWPDFPTRIVGGAMLAATLIAFVTFDARDGSFHLALAGIGLLYLMATMWLSRAATLTDLVLAPALAFLALIVAEALTYGDVFRAFANWQRINPEDTPPSTISWLVGMALVMSIIAALRGLAGAAYPRLWLIGAAILAPAAVILIDVFWYPPSIIGAGAWALHAMVVAGLMTLLAERTARHADIGIGAVAALALAALTMISLALVTMLSLTALTLALAAMTLGAAALDRRFNLAPLGWFVQLGALTTGWRLLIDPGVIYAERAPISELLLAYGGSILLMLAAWAMLSNRPRPGARIVLESVIVTAGSVFACILLYRWIISMDHGVTYLTSHWEIGLYSTVWLISSAAQLYRRRAGGPLNIVRGVLATLFALIGLLLVAITLTLLNPLMNIAVADPVIGWPFLSSLLIAYGLPALVLLLTARHLLVTRPWLRALYRATAGFLAVWYVALSIRHFWRGAYLDVPGVTDPEQYSYTVAMLLASVGLIILAYLRRSSALRKLGMAGIALTIAKVYLIDAAGLTGLTRFFSFLLLGLVLIGLAWLNRLIKAAEAARDNPLDGSGT